MTASIVGPVVGPVSNVTFGGSGAQNAGRGYDVAIGDLFFNVAPSDTKPYQRATAQFRKDQFDAAQTVGDQSLTGWWTRGQLSFHKGAGVTYYEVSEGDTVLNRYQSGEGVNPFVPGAVTLYQDWTDAVADTHVGTTFVGTAGDNLVVLDEGQVTYGALDAAGTDYSPDGGSVLAAACGNGDIFCATSDKEIVRIGLARTVSTVYGEQGFESGVDSFAGTANFGDYTLPTSVATSTDEAFEGSQSLKVTWAALDPGDTGSAVVRQMPPLVVGRAYTLVMKVYVPTGSADVRPTAMFAAHGDVVTTKDAWVTCSVTFTAYSSEFMYAGVLCESPASADVCYVDKVVLYEGTRDDYDDGSTPIDSLYSHAKNFVGLFYAKDRLFAVDEGNAWYQLAPDPSGVLPIAVDSGDLVFTVGGMRGWCVTDTPGPVLLGNGSRIFAVTVDSSGAIPTLSGPVQVADLPPEESVVGLAYHLGFVTIVTSAGVRMAVLSDSGQVQYGPPLVEWSSAPSFTGVGRHGSRVVVTGGHEVYEIDLSQQIGTGLEFAYTEMPNPFTGAETNYGAAIGPGLELVLWSDTDTLKRDTALTASGSLTTGYHRFATLEPKRFESVRLRAAGTKGTITVSKVDQNGAVSSIYTLDVSSDHTAEIGLGLTEAAEAVALKFTLARDAVDADEGPTLLGYQLRALPEPKRQRLIRVPLLIQDVERRQPARASGHTGAAWTRLRALEQLEDSGSAVLFKDFRTGESANVYIESVEFENRTPPSSQSNGFGGIAWLTVRKLV